MKRALVLGLLLVIGISAGAQKGATGRLLTGKVIDRQDNPLPNAVVYLTDTRTRAVKTYIVGADGAYRFPAMSANVDYEVYAQSNGKKSDTKMVSQFDNRTQVNINLRVDTR
jgi:hypothetical protein